MSRGSAYAVAGIVTGVAAILVFLPTLRPFLWPGIAWAIFIMAAIVALAVLGNILSVLYHTYTGYGPEGGEQAEETAAIQQQLLRFEQQTNPSGPKKVV